VHADSPSWDATDWQELVGLYDLLLDAWPSPVVALNKAVAVGFAAGPAAGLAVLKPLENEPQLTTYGYLVRPEPTSSGVSGVFLKPSRRMKKRSPSPRTKWNGRSCRNESPT